MNRYLLPSSLLFALCGSALHAQVNTKIKNIGVSAQSSEYISKDNLYILKGDVRIATSDYIITCDHATINMKSKDFTAKGNVIIRGLKGGMDMHTEEVQGNTEKRLFQIKKHDGRMGPWRIVGGGAESKADQRIIVKNVSFTTCDHADHDEHTCPHYRIEAEEVIHYENGDFEARKAWLYLGSVPVMPIPYFYSNINVSDGPLRLVPGYNSQLGGFLQISKKWEINEFSSSIFHLDLYSKAGLGLGNETEFNYDNFKLSWNAYGFPSAGDETTDDDDRAADGKRYLGRFDTPNSRYNFRLDNKIDWYDDHLISRLKLDILSDIDYRNDFRSFVEQTNQDLQSINYYDLQWTTENSSTSLYLQSRLNDFESGVERLPELRFDLPNYVLGDSNFTFSSHNSIAQLRAKWRDFDQALLPGTVANEDYESLRLDSLQSIHYNKKINGWLNFTPRAAMRATWYSDSSKNKVSTGDLNQLFNANDPYISPNSLVNNYDDQGNDKMRFAFELGYELSFKSYKTWLDAQNTTLGIDGLRHVMRPYINHTFIPVVTEDREQLYFFDETDRLSEQHWMRVGVEHRLQTRRDGELHTLLTMDNYFTTVFDDEDNNEGLGDFGTHAEFTPSDNFQLDTDVIVDLDDAEVNIFQLGTRIGSLDSMQLQMDYTHHRKHLSHNYQSLASSSYNPQALSSYSREYRSRNTLTARLRMLLYGKNYVQIGASYDLDEGEIFRKFIELQRKLHCWTMSLRMETRRSGFEDFNVMLYFYLNAYPSVSLGANQGNSNSSD